MSESNYRLAWPYMTSVYAGVPVDRPLDEYQYPDEQDEMCEMDGMDWSALRP